MSLLSKIGHFFSGIWDSLTGEAKKALPIVENVVNVLKSIDATGIPEDILDVVAGPAKGTEIEAGIKTALTTISTGLSKAAGIAAGSPQEALSTVIGMVDKVKDDAGAKGLLLSGIATQLYSAVTGLNSAHAAGLTALHYAGELGNGAQTLDVDPPPGNHPIDPPPHG